VSFAFLGVMAEGLDCFFVVVVVEFICFVKNNPWVDKLATAFFFANFLFSKKREVGRVRVGYFDLTILRLI